MMVDLRPNDVKPGTLSGRAASFFQQDIFKDIPGIGDEVDSEEDEMKMQGDSGVDVDSDSLSSDLQSDSDNDDGEEEMDDDDNAGMTETPEDVDDDPETESTNKPVSDGGLDIEEDHPEHNGRPNIDIITAEAMTLAHALATGKMTKQQLLDDNFNKYSHRDVDGLPEWFLDDENKHSRPHRPVSAEAAKAIKEKQRALNARPIKKVREAKARKTLRAARRLEKLKKKSEGLAEGGDMSERDKARNIAALMAKAKKGGKRKKAEVKVVRAGGQNKGAGRPRGVKGKYKMVDPRLKKDVRAEKRLAKKMKGGSR